MPSKEDFLSFFGPGDYEIIQWDPRMLLTVKLQDVRKNLPAHLQHTVGDLGITYQSNTECTEEEWAIVKENYAKLLELEKLHPPPVGGGGGGGRRRRRR
jgi:hypothetical protein